MPAGWTLVLADGFEGDKLANPKAEQLHVAQIECKFSHSGSCAVGARYVSNGNSFRWILRPGVIGKSDEVYVSWWEYLEPTARLNVEMFLGQTASSGSIPQFDIIDLYGSPGSNCVGGQGPGPSYNCEAGQVTLAGNYNGSSGGVNFSQYGNLVKLNIGTWRQYEWHFKANTPGNSDGAWELYANGQLAASGSGNLNGRIDMTGMEVDVGGTYTAGAWTDSGGTTCLAYPTGNHMHWCSPFSDCTPCPIPPDFNRYWDDIIVLKK